MMQEITDVTRALEALEVQGAKTTTAGDYRTLAAAVDRLAKNWFIASSTRRELVQWRNDAMTASTNPTDESWRLTVVDRSGVSRLLSRAASDASGRSGAIAGLIAGVVLGVVGSRVRRKTPATGG